MKYCPECGKKLEQKKKNNKTKLMHSKGNNYLKAAGILTVIAASLCFLIGVIGLSEYSSHTSYPYDSYGSYSYNVEFPAQYVLTVTFGFFALILGLLSGVMIFMRKLFNLVTIGQMSIIVATLLLLVVNYWFFVLLGVPIMTATVIALAFTNISRNEFSS